MNSTFDHHTEQYSWSSSVYRRGFPISFTVTCEDSDRIKSLSVVLRTGRIQRGNLFREYRVKLGYTTAGWTVKYEVINARNIVIHLHSPSNAIIGQYVANIYINERPRVVRKFLLFFNPWCPEDSVYVDNQAERREYIENTHTVIYMGTYSHISPRGWYLAQFQPYSIEAVLILLDRMPAEDRSSPVLVSRFLSALVNANDDNGVILGKWTGNYGSGVHPMAWNGSGNILAKFAKYRAPVRFGQCWVFCGVLCTTLRTCGIPARCITTYNSFHDHDGSLAWEMYFNRHLRPVTFRRQETMWNYHCWTEAWMDRKDLPSGYGGWQIVDSTPQERSRGFYRCGPASQRAVKEGNVDFPYDTGFVFAEVNADKIFYYQSPRRGFVVGRVDSTLVGRKISCKAVGSNSRMDLTASYKYPDNSPTEKIIQTKIRMRRKRYMNIPPSPVSIIINPPACVSFISDCHIYFTLNNASRTNCKVKFRLTIVSVNYKGTVLHTLMEELYETQLAGNGEKQFREVIPAQRLKQTLWSGVSMVKVDINGLVNGADFIHAESSFEIDRPRISIEGAPSPMYAGEHYRLRISVVNPFDRTFTNTKLYLNGDVLLNGRSTISVGTLRPGARFDREIDVSSKLRGEFFVYASLRSSEMSGFDQSLGLLFK